MFHVYHHLTQWVASWEDIEEVERPTNHQKKRMVTMDRKHPVKSIASASDVLRMTSNCAQTSISILENRHVVHDKEDFPRCIAMVD
jgi:homoaconitase/3-isopropylmalate dehydratase large subunit